MPARIFEAATLFGIALDAAKGIKTEPRQDGQRAALVSIIFGVVSLEAFLNEATEMASDFSKEASELEVVKTFSQVLTDAERLPLESKFVLANWILTGRSIDRGAQPYQDFALLLSIRNELVHFKPNESFDVVVIPGEMERRQKAVLQKLRSKNILADLRGAYAWTSPLTTKAVAEWSCDTVSGMVSDLVSKAPQNSQWGYLLRMLGRGFTPPE
jgi:hypothetical protein